VPGTIKEGKRAIWRLGQVRMNAAARTDWPLPRPTLCCRAGGVRPEVHVGKAWATQHPLIPARSARRSGRKPLRKASAASDRKSCEVLVMKGSPVRIRASASQRRARFGGSTQLAPGGLFASPFRGVLARRSDAPFRIPEQRR
jgi:hypothetical protein